MLTSPNYDVFQQVFALSQASNLVRTCTGPEEQLQEKLQDKLIGGGWFDQNVGKDWNIAWGPAVWRFKPGAKTPPDNVWFVAKHDNLALDDKPASAVYVVAIAATTGKFNDSYDWQTEDLAVDSVVELQAWLDQRDKIAGSPPKSNKAEESKVLMAYGTALGVHTLANEPPAIAKSSPVATASSPSSLCHFLQNLDVPDGAKLVFTGHSLGGALSPALALTLTQAGYLDKFKGKTYIYPTAGASPGNARFVQLFSKTFPPIECGPEFYQVWNKNVVNLHDVVPHAWCTDPTVELNFTILPTLYGNKANSIVGKYFQKKIVQKLLDKANTAGKGIYYPLNSSTFSEPLKRIPLLPFGYADDALFNHTTAYAQHILGRKHFHMPLCGGLLQDLFVLSGILGNIVAEIEHAFHELERVEVEEDN